MYLVRKDYHIFFKQIKKSIRSRRLMCKKTTSGDNDDIELPPEPTTCCMAGCANCVWIEYANTLSKIFNDNDERVNKIIMEKITDPNLKAFLRLELKARKLSKGNNKKDS